MGECGPTRRCSRRRCASSEIVGILAAGFSLTVIPLWSVARLSARPLGRRYACINEKHLSRCK
jgi:hypothetical protein